jgi:hypothetical protein
MKKAKYDKIYRKNIKNMNCNLKEIVAQQKWQDSFIIFFR